ncbi:RHS repeat-associated core domain-containing protein [Empedobacter falsenii]
MKHFYEKLIYSTFLALGSTSIQAQTATENFIKTQECLDATCATKKETVVYFDGLGREKQALQVSASPTGKTIVTQVEYDGFGRQAKENLPFPISSAANTIVSAATNGNTFYSTLTGDSTPFSEKTFENSPLNRVLAQAAPGNSWKKGANEIKFEYATNTATEVQKFGVTLNTAFVPTLNLSGNYAAGTLYKTVTTDENGQPIQEFKDKEGKVILKRINIPAISGNSSGNHDTYYVYDIYGNLTYVLPPKLVEVGGITVTTYRTHLPELGYQYQYDEKNRLVEKQLPGKGREFMVYDKLDRLVATRDSQNEWIFTKYDKFNRIVYTGTLPSSARATLQTAYNAATIYHETRGTSGGLSNNGITNGLYTNVAYPTAFTKITTINYYDEYTNLGVTPSSIDGQSVIGVTDIRTKGLPLASFTNVLGTTTWAKNYTYYDAKYIRPVATASTNYLGGYTNTASSLDFRGKPLKTVTKHKQLAVSTELTLTDEFVYYANELLKSQTHQINNGSKEYIVQNSYNEINQLTSKKVGNSVAATPLQTVDYKYNIRGWMTDINNIDVTETGTYKDLFSFKLNYNTITQLISNPANFKPLYNGNISETIWKTNDNKIRSYSYRYDGLNRLISANYIKGANEVVNAFNEDIKGYDKNGNINGIIRTGNQDLSSSPIWIDDLTYSYKANSNKLLSVTDSKIIAGFNDGNKTGDDYAYDVNGNLTVDKNKGITKITYNFLNLPTEVLWNASKKINYTYDASGVKLRKVVTDGTTITTTDYLGSFQYQNNVLQFFPTAEGYVNVTNGTAFNYVYNYTDHLGNVRLSYQKNTDGTVKVIDENNYYPFGLKHNRCGNGQLCLAEGSVSLDIVGSNSYKYKYNGKELQEELSLNLYDYGARNYDPAIGRWFNIDPLAEKSRRFSPYTYALNNPVYFIDPDGMMAEPPTGWASDWEDETGKYVYNEQNELHSRYVDGEFQGFYDAGQIELETAVVTAKGEGSTDSGLKIDEKNYNSAYSPYNPDAVSFSFNLGVNAIFFQTNVNLQLAITGGDFSILAGGDSRVGVSFDKIGFGPSASMNFHDNYGGNKDVLHGLTGSDVTTSGSLILGGSYSTSVKTDSKGVPILKNGQPVEATSGVRSYGVNLGTSVGGGRSITKSYEIFRLSK